MHDLATHKTKDLSPEAKHALEKLLGRDLAGDEEITILASRPHSAPEGEARRQAWLKLNEQMDKMSNKVCGDRSEIERLVDEVSDEVRHGPR